MFRVATVLDPAGRVVVHGENVPRTVNVVDQSVRLEAGKRVVISDLGQGNNQWAIVRSLGTGTPPAPPQGIELVGTLAELIGTLVAAGALSLGWARTVRYSLDHYTPVLGPASDGGTAYATVYRPPRDYRLMLPIDLSVGDTPGTPFGFTLVNRVEPPGRAQMPPAQVVGPRNTINNPVSFGYGPMPDGAAVRVGGDLVGYWYDPRAERDGLPGGAVVGPDALMSQTVAAVFLGPTAAETNNIPTFPASVTPAQVFAENANPQADVDDVDGRLDRNLGRQTSSDSLAAIFIGADFSYPDLGIEYIDAQARLFSLLAS